MKAFWAALAAIEIIIGVISVAAGIALIVYATSL